MFRIERARLVEDIWSKSQQNSVLITGSPGIGKSWLAVQVGRYCHKQGQLYLPIIAEEYPVNSVEELQSALRLKSDVISFLRSLPGTPVLIIDGLDSLRSDPSQRTYRELIRRVTQQVPNCTIIASIRTFDLRQSQEFQRLFFSSDASKHKPFIEMPVPLLLDDELSAVASQVPALEPLVRNATGDFRQLLRNPFNLRLASELSEAGTPADELGGFHSQVQLLTKYWEWRIETPADHHDRIELLRVVAKAMVDQKSLSVAKAEVYKSEWGTLFDRLQSDEILRQSVTSRVSFAHNILFDYAVARLVWDETTITQFIVDDPSRTIFFRPSLAYFFHYLWLLNRDLFWKLSFSFFESTKLPERARIIPAVTIYEASRLLDDLNPILPCATEAQTRAVVGTLRAAQALGGLQSSARILWLAVLAKLTANLKVEFINEYTFLLKNAHETKTPEESSVIFLTATSLLLWIWEESEQEGRDQAIRLADFGAVQVLPIVLQNYTVQPKVAGEIVSHVLGRYGSERAGADEARCLARDIKSIIENDPATAVEVYKKTFGYKEESKEKTQMGGAALTMTSTREQDYSTALYVLQAAFPTFVAVAPKQAAVAAIEAVNAEVEREHPPKKEDEGGTPAEFTFKWDGREIRYRSDYSEIWDRGSREDLSLNLLNSILMYVTDDLSKDDPDDETTQIVGTIIERSSLGVVWKRLFQVAEARIRVWYPLLRNFLTIPELISAPETTIGVGQVLKVAYAECLVSPSEGLALEKAILTIPDSKVIVRYEKPESIRNRLLMCIPRQQIQSKEAATLADELLKAAESVRENRPYHTSSFSQMPYGTHEWLRDQGVDTAKTENATLLSALEPLQSFETKYLNGVPPKNECVELDPLLERVEDLLRHSAVDDKVSETATGALCGAAEVILKNAELSDQDSIFVRCRNIVLRGAKDPWPPFNPKETFAMPGWGGGLPRIESAQGLSHILWNRGLDPEVVKAIRDLSQDQVAAVRFQIATGLLGFWKHKAFDEFWTLLETMIANERTPGVMTALVEVLGRVSGIEPERVAQILSQIFERGTPPTDRNELTRALVQVTVGLFAFRNNQRANELLVKFEADPIKFHREIAEEIVAVSPYLASQNKAEAEAGRKGRELLIRILINVYRELDELVNDQSERDKSDDFKTLLTIIDEVAMRIFFALDASPYGSGGQVLDDESRKSIYFELKPVLEFLTVRRSLTGTHYLAPPTALHLMQTLNVVLAYDPATVVEYAAAVVKAGSKMGYHFDRDAIGEMVKLVEHVLADHREILKERAVADALGDMLDKFVSVWPQAMGLTFRLDQAIR